MVYYIWKTPGSSRSFWSNNGSRTVPQENIPYESSEDFSKSPHLTAAGLQNCISQNTRWFPPPQSPFCGIRRSCRNYPHPHQSHRGNTKSRLMCAGTSPRGGWYLSTRRRAHRNNCGGLPHEKPPSRKAGGLCWHYLFSRPVTRQLSSAQMSLTSVFGMGTGGPSSQSIPTMQMALHHRLCQSAFAL